MVNVRWIDDGTSRPTSVDVHILKGDNPIHTLTVTEIEDEELGSKDWYNSCLVEAYDDSDDPITYTVSVDVAGYEATITETAADCFDILLVAEGQEARAANVDAVIDLIDEIGTVEYTKECIAKIKAARLAFDALSDEDQDLVYNVFVLVSAEREFEQKFAHLVEIDAEIEEVCNNITEYTQSERISALNKVSNKAIKLELDERNMLFNMDTLNSTLIEVASWQIVVDKINAVGDVKADEASKTKIDDARESYNELTDDEKKLIENYDELEKAEAEYFAKRFLDDVESALATPGATSDVAGTLSPIWNEKDTPDGKSFREMWKALTEGSKKLLKESDSEDVFVEFRNKYVEIITDNSDKLKPFENGPAFPEPVTPERAIPGWAMAGIVFGSVALVGCIVIASVLVYRKKKRAQQ